MPLVYAQLKRLAHSRLQNERANHTLNTTGLVHEAYLRLADVRQMRWESRVHFMATASMMMRRILINYARDRKALKRGGGASRQTLKEDVLIREDYAQALLDLDDSLRRLEAEHPRQGEVVQHRYFGGLTNEETAEVLGASLRTVERDLRFARAWLSREWRSNGNSS